MYPNLYPNRISQHLYLHQTKLFLSNGVLFWRKIPVATRKWERLVRARCLVSISFALKRETTSKYWAFSFTLFRLCLQSPSKKLDTDWILDYGMKNWRNFLGRSARQQKFHYLINESRLESRNFWCGRGEKKLLFHVAVKKDSSRRYRSRELWIKITLPLEIS